MLRSSRKQENSFTCATALALACAPATLRCTVWTLSVPGIYYERRHAINVSGKSTRPAASPARSCSFTPIVEFLGLHWAAPLQDQTLAIRLLRFKLTINSCLGAAHLVASNVARLKSFCQN